MSLRRRAEKIRLNCAGRLLAQNPRLLGVLELVAQKAGWGKPLPAGRFRGVAVVNNVGSYTAQVAEISVDSGQGAGPSRGVRGGLRTRGESGDCGAADPQRHRLRADGRAERPDHHRQGPRAAGEFQSITTCCGSMKRRWWKSISSPARRTRVGLARPECPLLRLRFAMRCSQLPVSGFAVCR